MFKHVYSANKHMQTVFKKKITLPPPLFFPPQPHAHVPHADVHTCTGTYRYLFVL